MSQSIAEQQRVKLLEARVAELEHQVAAMHAALALTDAEPERRKPGRPRKHEAQVQA